MGFKTEPLFTTNKVVTKSAPITKQTKAEIQERLNEKVRIKRELNKLGLGNVSSTIPKNIQLNTTSIGTFDVFKFRQDKSLFEEEKEEDLMRLIPVGSLSIFEDLVPIKEPLVSFNSFEYTQKRRRLEEKFDGPTRLETIELDLDFLSDHNTTIESPQIVDLVSEPLESTITSAPNEISYPSQMVPIYPTPEQSQECDAVAGSIMQSKIDHGLGFRKSIDILNCFFADLDTDSENFWKLSGKLQFIKEFLDASINQNLTIVITTKGLNEESLVYHLVNDCLRLACTRIGNVLDDRWNGEYGVFLKTKKTEQEEDNRSIIRLFKPEADLIIFMDITIDRSGLEAFTAIEKTGNEKLRTLWLVTLGSFEERAFRLMQEKSLSFSECEESMKEILCKDNVWPKQHDGLNKGVALNLLSWLHKAEHTVEYQYQSTIQSGDLIASNTVFENYVAENSNTENVQDTTSPMDIDSTSNGQINEPIPNDKPEFTTHMLEHLTKTLGFTSI
ncbi:hypothetical protein G6F56_008056 [Rhizopus delemar]|nr:hypothetical protein G6F56_008056 [Rhizopus delemar]